MESKTQCAPDQALSPVVEICEVKPAPGGAEVPDVVVVFELDQRQYAAARPHFDHLIDNHSLSAHVHFEEQL